MPLKLGPYELTRFPQTSDLYESAIEVERFMAAIYKKNREYQKLAECYSELHQFCEKIVTAVRLFLSLSLCVCT